MSDIHVTIIMLNWNRYQDTLNCLESLYTNAINEPAILSARQHKGNTLKTNFLVVDNGSTDNSIAMINQTYPEVQILALNKNFGFGRGMNYGIQEALQKGADYVLLLNNDTFVSSKFVVRMLECMDIGVGLVAPFIYYKEPANKIWSIGYNFCQLLWEIQEIVPEEPGNLQQQIDCERIYCDGVTGCAMLIKRAVIEEVGGFDERFFMYYEDLDLCLRINNSGYQIVVTPQAKIWHLVSQSSGGGHSPSARFHHALSSGRYFRKWMRPWQVPLILSYRLFSAFRWSLRLGRLGKWQALSAYWRGLGYGWLGPSTVTYSLQ